MRLRIALATAGILLGLFGVFRLLTQIPGDDLLYLAFWLGGALVLHDGILSPIVIGVSAVLERFVPGRARRYLQGFLIAGALVTVIAVPMIHRAYSQPPAKAILEQNFSANLTVLLAILGGAALLLYLLRVLRDRASR